MLLERKPLTKLEQLCVIFALKPLSKGLGRGVEGWVEAATMPLEVEVGASVPVLLTALLFLRLRSSLMFPGAPGM